jgi:hypothetical protein
MSTLSPIGLCIDSYTSVLRGLRWEGSRVFRPRVPLPLRLGEVCSLEVNSLENRSHQIRSWKVRSSEGRFRDARKSGWEA